MNWKNPPRLSLYLFLTCLAIHIFSRFPMLVENVYSLGFYKYFSIFLRSLFGFLPFSFGDVLYAAATLYLLIKILKYIRHLFHRKNYANIKQKGKQKLIKLFNITAVIYIVFNLFWGINYNRLGIAQQLGLQMKTYSKADLQLINELLLQKVNEHKMLVLKSADTTASVAEMFSSSEQAYAAVAQKYPFLKYQKPSLKPTLFSSLGNYLGFTGYYNPFTGEAQVNTSVPAFSLPYTSCHEIAHQLGYAKEMEANFVGYLAAKSSANPSFTYACYLDLFKYANRNLFSLDSVAARKLQAALLPQVQTDLEVWRAFFLKYKNAIEPYTHWLYGVFLKSNQQPQGMLSYDEVTAFMIAYYKKFKEI